MTDLLRLVVDIIQYIWPFEIVHQWQRGAYYVCGRYWRTVGPGVYPRLPYFMDILQVDMVPETPNPMQTETITTRDGGTLTWCPIFEFEVFDAALVLNSVTNYEEKSRMDAWAVVADTLADLPEGRLEAEAQKRLRATCLRKINERLNPYGVQCNVITFTTFVRNMKNYKLFTGP